MVIDDSRKGEIVEAFKAIAENKEQAKALNSSNTELFKHLAETLQCDKKAVTSAFRYWKENIEKGDDPLEDVTTIFEMIKD